MSLPLGARIGPYEYEIVARLGAGGMGEVYRATDARRGRDDIAHIHGQLSPDGKWVRWPRWAKSGRELFYWTAPAAIALMSVSFQGASMIAGEPGNVFDRRSGSTWDVAPDGDDFLVEGLGSRGDESMLATVTNWFDELRRRAPAKK